MRMAEANISSALLEANEGVGTATAPSPLSRVPQRHGGYRTLVLRPRNRSSSGRNAGRGNALVWEVWGVVVSPLCSHVNRVCRNGRRRPAPLPSTCRHDWSAPVPKVGVWRVLRTYVCGRQLSIPASVERSVEQNLCLILCSGRNLPPALSMGLRLCLLTIQHISVLFGNGGDSRRNNANNDDPIILDVEADEDGPARNTNAPRVIPPSTWPAVRVSPVSQRRWLRSQPWQRF